MYSETSFLKVSVVEKIGFRTKYFTTQYWNKNLEFNQTKAESSKLLYAFSDVVIGHYFKDLKRRQKQFFSFNLLKCIFHLNSFSPQISKAYSLRYSTVPRTVGYIFYNLR